MELILIRHGLPEKIVNQDGTPADPPLSEIGLDQAERVGQWLKDYKIDKLYSSPMRRAMETAIPLSQLASLEVELHDGVAEFDRTAKNYIPVEELKTQNYEQWKRLMEGKVDADFPQFAETVNASLNQIVQDNPGKRVAVACHGGVINVWTAHVIGFEPRLFFNPNYTSINRYMAASSGEKSVISLNEYAHLKG